MCPHSSVPSVPWQRCQFHLSQKAQRYARRSDERTGIATDIRDIFNAPSGGEAEVMLRARVKQYRDRNPELADWMETNLPEGFTVFRFPRSTWRRIRTNNGLENLNRQIRRRTQPALNGPPVVNQSARREPGEAEAEQGCNASSRLLPQPALNGAPAVNQSPRRKPGESSLPTAYQSTVRSDTKRSMVLKRVWSSR